MPEAIKKAVCVFALVAAITSHRLNSKLDMFVTAENLFNHRYLTGRTPVTTIGPPILIRGGIRFRFSSN